MPLELIARFAALVQSPRAHRHRYYGMLPPNSPLRAAALALAEAQAAGQLQAGLQAPRRPLNLCQCLREIFKQIINVFNAKRQANHVCFDTSFG